MLTKTPNLVNYEAHLDNNGIIDLHSMPSLQRLSLQVGLLLARTDPMPWIIPSFSTISAGNNLADVSITCIIDKPPPDLTIQTFDSSLAGWRAFDDLLSQSTFSALKRFRLDFALDNPIGDETLQQLSNEYIKQLPNLERKGVLEVDVCEIR